MCSKPEDWPKTRPGRWPTGCGRRRCPRSSARTTSSGRKAPSGEWSRPAGRTRSSCGARPGTGKTTIARLLSTAFKLHFEQLSAVFSGVADLKKTFEAARQRRKMGQGTLLFIDEIHRFNRSQQDSFLPVVEDGTVVLVGATTENPSFELNGALLSPRASSRPAPAGRCPRWRNCSSAPKRITASRSS
ncbi:MAG: AAA family ATPase [Rhizomicrobium sp.]